MNKVIIPNLPAICKHLPNNLYKVIWKYRDGPGAGRGFSPRISYFYPRTFPITFANFAIIFGQEKTPTISDGGFFTLVF
jgi:hypothetical protein